MRLQKGDQSGEQRRLPSSAAKLVCPDSGQRHAQRRPPFVDEGLAAVPIMAVTAYSAQGDEERIRAAGAQAYVSKPISVVRFAETVDQLLKNGSDKAEVAEGTVDPGSTPG